MKKILLLIVVIIVVVFIVANKPHKSNLPACSNGSPPCIELLHNGKVVSKFNDFRFCGANCVWYLDKAWTKFNGQYQLKWIGPAGKSI